MISELAKKPCIPCESGAPALKGEALKSLKKQLGAGWKVVDDHHLEKEYKLKNFREALDFTNQVGELAEEHNHHPDIYLAWGLVRITLWTHSAGGLTEPDFIIAAKIQELWDEKH